MLFNLPWQINTTESTSTLHIPEVFPEDTGVFMVKAYNMYGTVQCKAKLTVVEEEETTERVNSPEFRNLIHDINTVQGEPATFDCQVTGRPRPTVQWRKVGYNRQLHSHEFEMGWIFYNKIKFLKLPILGLFYFG